MSGADEFAGRAVFCTLATRVYRPRAQVCLDSLRALHPEIPRVLLDVDGEVARETASGERVLRLADCIEADTLREMRRRYTTPELCFAAKPFLIAALLARGAGQVHYLDGDCCVYARLDPLIEQLNGCDLLLTPHSLGPLPDDDRTPRALAILRGGAFNAGYLGVRGTEAGRGFLRWLARTATRYAHNRPDAGMCGDQKWLDLAPAYCAGTGICRHPGANVAYWNLHERTIGRDPAAQGYRIGPNPLLFFHFSGFDPQQPRAISRYQNRHSPPDLGTPLAQLVDDYAARLLAAGEVPARKFWRPRRSGARKATVAPS